MRRTIVIASIFSSLSLAAAFYPLDLLRDTFNDPSLALTHTERIIQPNSHSPQSPMNPGPVQGAPDGDNKVPSSPSAGDTGPPGTQLSISDILPQTRKINIFASLTRDISSVTGRLESTNTDHNTTLLAPLNSAMQALPRKPWEDRPDDSSSVRAESNEDKAASNLQRFVEEHVVPVSPWEQGKAAKVKTLGGQELWWEKDDEGKRVVWPGGLVVDEVVGVVGNGEIWAVKGVVNYE